MQILFTISVGIPQVRILYQQGREIFGSQFHDFLFTCTQANFLCNLYRLQITFHVFGIGGELHIVYQGNQSIHFSLYRFS